MFFEHNVKTLSLHDIFGRSDNHIYQSTYSQKCISALEGNGFWIFYKIPCYKYHRVLYLFYALPDQDDKDYNMTYSCISDLIRNLSVCIRKKFHKQKRELKRVFRLHLIVRNQNRGNRLSIPNNVYHSIMCFWYPRLTKIFVKRVSSLNERNRIFSLWYNVLYKIREHALGYRSFLSNILNRSYRNNTNYGLICQDDCIEC